MSSNLASVLQRDGSRENTKMTSTFYSANESLLRKTGRVEPAFLETVVGRRGGLRSILAQRYVDRLRQSRRWEQFETEEEGKHGYSPQPGNPEPVRDPHRDRYLARFVAALQQALALLAPADREHLEFYYAREKTLAEIGRALGEHESSVSRNLERIRRLIRSSIEEILRCPPALSEAEIALCFQYAAEDSPIDFRQIFPEKTVRKSGGSGKESL